MLIVDAVAEVQTDWIRQAGSCGSCLIWSTALLAAYLFLAQVKKCLQYRRRPHAENLPLDDGGAGQNQLPATEPPPVDHEVLVQQFPLEAQTQVALFVSPNCTNELIRLLWSAQAKILVAVPALDHEFVVQVLRVRASEGVKIKILLSSMARGERSVQMRSLNKLLRTGSLEKNRSFASSEKVL